MNATLSLLGLPLAGYFPVPASVTTVYSVKQPLKNTRCNGPAVDLVSAYGY